MNRPRRFFPPLGPPPVNARQRVLSAWRGVNLAPLEGMKGKPAQTVGGVMERVLAGLRIDQRRGEAEIAKVWSHLLAPDVVAHAQPTGIHKGTLFVTVDSSVWLDEIVRYRRKEILLQLQTSFGKDLITRISFRVG